MKATRPSTEGLADRETGSRTVRLCSTGAGESAAASRGSLDGPFPAWATSSVYSFGAIVYREARSQRPPSVSLYTFLPFVYRIDSILYRETKKVYTAGPQERGTEAN